MVGSQLQLIVSQTGYFKTIHLENRSVKLEQVGTGGIFTPNGFRKIVVTFYFRNSHFLSQAKVFYTKKIPS